MRKADQRRRPSIVISRDGGLTERTRRAGARHREKDCPSPSLPLTPDFRSPLGCRDDSIARTVKRVSQQLSAATKVAAAAAIDAGRVPRTPRAIDDDDGDVDGFNAADATQMHPVGGTRSLVSSSTMIHNPCERCADIDSLGTRRTRPVLYDTREKLKRRARHFYPDTISTRHTAATCRSPPFARCLFSRSMGTYPCVRTPRSTVLSRNSHKSLTRPAYTKEKTHQARRSDTEPPVHTLDRRATD